MFAPHPLREWFLFFFSSTRNIGLHCLMTKFSEQISIYHQLQCLYWAWWDGWDRPWPPGVLRVSVGTFRHWHLFMEYSVLLTVSGCTNDYLLLYQSSEPHIILANPACHPFLVYLFLLCIYLLYHAQNQNWVSTNCFMTKIFRTTWTNIYHHAVYIIAYWI